MRVDVTRNEWVDTVVMQPSYILGVLGILPEVFYHFLSLSRLVVQYNHLKATKKSFRCSDGRDRCSTHCLRLMSSRLNKEPIYIKVLSTDTPIEQ